MKSKVGIIIALASFPLMLGFQNCAKTQLAATDKANEVSKVDTNNIPSGQEVNVDQTGADSGDSSAGAQDSAPGDVGYQIEDREMVRQRDMDEAEVICANINESNNHSGTNVIKTDGTISGLRGNNVVSPEDFNGVDSIESVSNSYGKIIICNMSVKDVYQTGGKIILVNSEIENLISHHGDVDIVQGRAVIQASKGVVYKKIQAN